MSRKAKPTLPSDAEIDALLTTVDAILERTEALMKNIEARVTKAEETRTKAYLEIYKTVDAAKKAQKPLTEAEWSKLQQPVIDAYQGVPEVRQNRVAHDVKTRFKNIRGLLTGYRKLRDELL